MALLAHKDTSYVSESAVRLIPAPKWTRSWHPISHGQLIDATQAAVNEVGLDIIERKYSLNRAGTKLFAYWGLSAGNNKIGYALGFRHAIDRSMKILYLAGTNVFICDNMCFSGSENAFRMHTGGLNHDRLIIIATKALGSTVRAMGDLIKWQESLKETYVPRADFKQLVFDMVAKGIFPGSQINNYLNCLDEEKKIYHGTNLDRTTNLYAVHGAATRLMRPWSLLRISKASIKLKAICDDYLLSRAA